jgi:prevent-host-death family protein
METVSKSALKARMLEYFRRVEETGEPLIVTSNRVPVLRIVPFSGRGSVDELFADVRGRVTLPPDGVLNEPVDEVWEDMG